MSYYFIANIRINDEDEYQKYLDRAGEVFKKYNGKYLAVDKTPKVIEGSWEYSRAVIIEFNTEEDFNRWYNSPDYQEILKCRLASSACDTIFIKGLN
jgi:uncharacterized protein (DUF1330 family)